MFEPAIRQVQDGRKALADASRSTSSVWKDAARASFDRHTVEPLLRSTGELINQLEASASIVQGSLRMIR